MDQSLGRCRRWVPVATTRPSAASAFIAWNAPASGSSQLAALSEES